MRRVSGPYSLRSGQKREEAKIFWKHSNCAGNFKKVLTGEKKNRRGYFLKNYMKKLHALGYGWDAEVGNVLMLKSQLRVVLTRKRGCKRDNALLWTCRAGLGKTFCVHFPFLLPKSYGFLSLTKWVVTFASHSFVMWHLMY